MKHLQFPIRKGGIFRPGKEIEGLRGGVHGYRLVRAEKDLFRMETNTTPTFMVAFSRLMYYIMEA